MLNHLKEIFQETFEDKILSNSEKQALEQIIEEAQYSPHQLDVLRSYIFEIANNEIKNHSSKQILTWLEKANKALVISEKESIINQVYFSPGEICKQKIIETLHQAKQLIKICVFTISDNEITDEIVACLRKGIEVKVITDNEKMEDQGSDIWILAKENNIQIKVDNTSNHMHHKFMIVDEAFALTGSYNWTRSAGLYNHENILITNDAKITKAYNHEFEKLWKAFPSYQTYINNQKQRHA